MILRAKGSKELDFGLEAKATVSQFYPSPTPSRAGPTLDRLELGACDLELVCILFLVTWDFHVSDQSPASLFTFFSILPIVSILFLRLKGLMSVQTSSM